ncbi:MAG: 4-alpha-glucanotransferase, partial [Clostridia bacterium]|nr:4-alpha-glucanotransferase [Clostridia bacterium]
MELFACHNSREKRYRSPQGALPCGTEAVLRLRLWGSDAERASVMLRLWSDGHENLIRGQREYRDGALYHVFYFRTSETPQLEWYYFIIDVGGERRFYGGRTGEGKPSGQQPPDFQITVYDGSYHTPDWFKEAVVYQIFPDRFNRGKPDKDGRTALDRLDFHEKLGRRVFRHYDWNEPVLHTALPGEKHYAPCDYFGGDLEGVREKLPYIASLGVSCIYLNPIFEAASNHRYNTGDYMRVDPVLGTGEDLAALVRDASALGIRIMADGVFSHTGEDSVYFNRYGRYNSVGAYSGPQSPYFGWYDFKRFPDKYRCWWGFETLPEVKEDTPTYVEFIGNVLKKWSRYGITSWRLDVADELPDSFIEKLRTMVKANDPEGVLLGEVWDDASNKVWEKGLRR